MATSMLLVVTLLGGCEPGHPWQSELVSVNADGTNSGNRTSPAFPGDLATVFSPDGTKIAFTSEASDLGPTDTNRVADVYMRDLAAGTTTLISVNAAGTDSGNGPSHQPLFSPDGTKIVFHSLADDLGPTDTNDLGPIDTYGFYDVYMRDLAAGTTTLISVNAAGTDSGNDRSGRFAASGSPAFNPDGTKIAFESAAGDLVARDTNDETDVFVRDLPSGTTTLVSANAAGTDSGNDQSGWRRWSPAFSPDGTKIAFASGADDLGPTDTNETDDVYLRDLPSGTTTLVSANAAGTDSGNDVSQYPAFSPDGTKIAFISRANDLGPTDTTNTDTNVDVYVRDLAAGTTTLVSTNAAGTDSGNDMSRHPVFSPDGTKIAFISGADDLGPNDANETEDVFVRDLVSGTTTLVSANTAGTDSGDGRSIEPLYSPDGTKIAFVSNASDLGPNDINETVDVFVRDLVSGTTTLVSANAAGTDSGNSWSHDPVYSPDGTKIAFVSNASDLGPNDQERLGPARDDDIYLATQLGTNMSIDTMSDS